MKCYCYLSNTLCVVIFKISKYEEKQVNLGGLNRFSYVQVLFCCMCPSVHLEICTLLCVCSWCTVVSLLLYVNTWWAYKPTDAEVSLAFPDSRH